MRDKDLTIKDIYEGLKNKKFSTVELVKYYIDKIKKQDQKLHSFLFISEESALKQAKEIDDSIVKRENINYLTGSLFAVKDNILVENQPATAGSKILENYVAPYDATCIKELKKQGAIVIGKTNCDEFAMGSSTENSAFGPTKNPWDLSRVPGGSSGGSTAAVAANLCNFALGSETGGSVRQPASFCGVVGLKPTYGAVSRFGLIAFASSLDQIGPVTKTVQDCKIVFDIISKSDELDSTSVKQKPLEHSFDKPIDKMIAGIPKEYFVEGIEPKVLKLIESAIEFYKQQGVKIKEISLPHTEYALPCYYIIVPSEASANLARYDGIKYGFSSAKQLDQNQDLLDIYLNSRGRGFGDEVRRRIMLGTFSLSSGYYEAYYVRAQKVRNLIKEDFNKAFKQVDVILTPVSPTTAFKLGEKTQDPLQMYLSDIFTASANLAGIPAISVPCGKADGLPVGLQIIGDEFQEEKIMQLADVLERNNN